MKTAKLRAGLAAVMGLAIASTALTAVAATAASASTSGQVKICKTFTTPPAALSSMSLTPVFNYTISAPGMTTISVPVTAGTCSAIYQVSSTSTSAVITELGLSTTSPAFQSWFSVSSITEPAGQSYLGATSLTAGTASVTLSTGNVDTVSYTNQVIPGYVEVCKQSVTGSGLSGTYGFTVTGSDGFSNSSTAAAVGINNCSDPIEVPAGTVGVSENGTNLYVTGISAQTNGTGASDIVTDSLTAGTATVSVAPSADTSIQTDITYTNNVVLMEVCKTWSNDNGLESLLAGGSSTLFPFTVAATGAAGPNTAPAPFSIAAGTCSAPVAYRPGTTVTVTEGIVPGSKVEAITPTGAESVVPGSLSLTNRTVQIIVGNPTSGGSDVNEAVVTFTNEYANPGELKICKNAGTVPGPPVGTSFNFTVSGVTGTTTVNLGNCAFVVNSSGATVLFPFNSTETVTEAASANNMTSAIVVSPLNVTEVVAGVPTLTSETVLSGTPNLGGIDTTSSVNVVIGEQTLTEATFTDVDPPATVTSPVTVTIPGGTNLGTVTAPTSGIAVQIAGSSSVSSAAQAIATAATTKVQLTKAQIKAALKADNKLLTSVNNKIATVTQRLKTSKGHARKVELMTLAVLKARQHVLKLEIKLL